MPNSKPQKLQTDKVRGGRTVKGMTIVLSLSTLAAVILMMIVFAGNAAS